MKRLLFTALFLVIWLPCLLFTATNGTTAPRMKSAYDMAGPFKWKYVQRHVDFSALPPRLLIEGYIVPKDGAPPGETFMLQTDFIEWLYSGSGMRHRVNKGMVYATGMPDRPYASQWDIEHDYYMRFTVGDFRFNGYFILGLAFSLLLLPLFVLWMMADDIAVVTPEERKRRDAAFLELVKLVEARAKGDKKWLKRKTIRLALLGYAVVLGSVVLMLPIGIGLGAAVVVMTGGNVAAAKLAFILAAVPIGFAFALGKSLLIDRMPPAGVELKPQDAPALFAFLDDIIKEAEGPRFKHVYISDEMNASVSRSTGWLGFFGFGPVTLTMGLPLLQALTVDQLAGVVGHEYGHVAAKDNALGHWVYRIRNSWLVLGDRLHLEKLWYALKLNRFYAWFIGVFSAYSFALSRQCEYEADAFSAKLAGAQNAGSALCAVAVRGDEIASQYWRDVWKRAEAAPNIATEAPYSAMPSWFAAPHAQEEIIKAVKARKSGYASTHPSTIDRLAALGQDFTPPEPITQSAAAALLGQTETLLAKRFDAEWQAAARPHWERAHEQHNAVTARHAELSQRAFDSLTVDELHEMITAADRRNDDPAIIAASEEILKREPDNAGAKMNVAGLKLAAGDETQLQAIAALIEAEPQMYAHGCRHALHFLHKTGRAEDAKAWQDKLDDWEYRRQAAQEERELVLASDEYEPHGLPDDAVRAFARHCSESGGIHTVYLARKKVKYMPEYPSYLIAFRLRQAPFKSQKKTQQELNDFISKAGMGSCLFIDVTSVAGLEGKMKKTAGARIWTKKDGKLA